MLSAVHITGQNGQATTANLQPLLSSSVTIGSTISVEGLGYLGGGADMAIFVGDYAVKNGADIVTGTYCTTTVGKIQLPGNIGVVTSDG